MEPQQTSGASGAGITVTGSGRAGAIPEVFVLEIAAEADSGSVAEALRLASEALHRIRTAALAHGVQPRQLSSRSMSVTQRYNDTHFECRLPITVRSTDLDRAGDLVVACVEAGADRTRLLGTSFEHTDRADLLIAARDAAFTDALDRAARLATRAGRELGAVHQILDGMPIWGGEPGGGAMAMAASAPSVDPGTLDVTATVTVSWAWA